MKVHLWILLLLCIFIAAPACGWQEGLPSSPSNPQFPPPSFQEGDLIGTWEDEWKGDDVNQTLLLMADKTFKQIYDELSSHYHFEGKGNWWVEYRPSGCVFVHLEGVRDYDFGHTPAESGNRDFRGEIVPFWDFCEGRVIEMPDGVILQIMSDSQSPRGILLGSPASNDKETGGTVFRLTDT